MTSLRPRYLTVFAPAVLSFGAAAATEQGAGIASLVIPVFGVAARAADPTGGPFAAAGAVLATAPVVLLTVPGCGNASAGSRAGGLRAARRRVSV